MHDYCLCHRTPEIVASRVELGVCLDDHRRALILDHGHDRYPPEASADGLGCHIAIERKGFPAAWRALTDRQCEEVAQTK